MTAAIPMLPDLCGSYLRIEGREVPAFCVERGPHEVHRAETERGVIVWGGACACGLPKRPGTHSREACGLADGSISSPPATCRCEVCACASDEGCPNTPPPGRDTCHACRSALCADLAADAAEFDPRDEPLVAANYGDRS